MDIFFGLFFLGIILLITFKKNNPLGFENIKEQFNKIFNK